MTTPTSAPPTDPEIEFCPVCNHTPHRKGGCRQSYRDGTRCECAYDSYEKALPPPSTDPTPAEEDDCS
jgi:hypothetical protein